MFIMKAIFIKYEIQGWERLFYLTLYLKIFFLLAFIIYYDNSIIVHIIILLYVISLCFALFIIFLFLFFFLAIDPYVFRYDYFVFILLGVYWHF